MTPATRIPTPLLTPRERGLLQGALWELRRRRQRKLRAHRALRSSDTIPAPPSELDERTVEERAEHDLSVLENYSELRPLLEERDECPPTLRDPSLDRCLACSEGILDSRLGGMCGDCES